MLELPEVLTIAPQLTKELTGKRIVSVLPPTKPHKFCWFSGEPEQYELFLGGATVVGAEGFGIYVELSFDNGMKLCFNDGVNARLIRGDETPKNYQLLIILEDCSLVFTVAMYGGIILHNEDYNENYYVSSRKAPIIGSDEFHERYIRILGESSRTLSVKAFLATEQRFPGIGNGVIQDILWNAGIHPKRKVITLGNEERVRLYKTMLTVLNEMTDKGGRDTERDLYGNPGGYVTRMSKNGIVSGCPRCGGVVVKEAYMGGSVYYCTDCQPLD